MLLEELSNLNGASGAEKNVREAIRAMVEPYVDAVYVDKIGNLIAVKRGNQEHPRIMLAAHMDEVGLMITDIKEDGFLKFEPVGGIDPRVLISKPVRIGRDLIGVIGSKAIHLQKSADRKKALTIDQLYIDIGAKSKEDAGKHVKIGDYAHFMTECAPLGDSCWKGKAFDDRVGCAAIIEILKQSQSSDFTLYAAFTVQEEVGLRGSQVAAYGIGPDFAVVLEGTVSADMPDVEEQGWVTRIGAGPACSLMDRTTLYNPKLIAAVTKLAKAKNLPLQFRQGSSGGNDAGCIHLNKTGVPVIALSVPSRYIHSSVTVISNDDYENCIRLVGEIIKEIPQTFLNAR